MQKPRWLRRGRARSAGASQGAGPHRRKPSTWGAGLPARTLATMLPDLLRPGLRVVFVGTSVSTRSAAAGHYYSNPTNKFWQLLAATGLPAGSPVGAPLDATLPDIGLGLTDLVKRRAASSDALLQGGDYDVPRFLSR